MPDTLNPESLRRAAKAGDDTWFRGIEIQNGRPVHALDNFYGQHTKMQDREIAKAERVIAAYLAAEAERVQSIGLVRASLAEMQRHHAARRALRDAIGDLLHMHRQGDVSAEIWGRVEAAFDGAKP